MILKVLYVILGIVLVSLIGTGVSVYLAHDFDYRHTRETAQLADFPGQIEAGISLRQIRAGNYTFRTRVAGWGGTRGNLILLHGFPETSIMWQPLMVRAASAGYQVLAFDQRGYSPGARPGNVADYGTNELTDDVLAVADAAGFNTFHLVGHDWGAGVGWALVLTHPERIESWTSLSIPHIASFGAALENDPDQQRKSAYMILFRMPYLPEALFSFNDFWALKNTIYTQHGDAAKEEYLAVFREPGAMTAALNWYRAAANWIAAVDPVVNLPVLFIWGNQDPAVGRTAVEQQAQYLKGPFQEIELDAGHWLMETHAEQVSAAILRHINTFGTNEEIIHDQ